MKLCGSLSSQQNLKESLFQSEAFDFSKYEQEIKFDFDLLTEQFQNKPRSKKSKESKQSNKSRKRKRNIRIKKPQVINRYRFLKYLKIESTHISENDPGESMDKGI